MKKKVTCFGELLLRLNPPGYQRLTQAQSFDITYGGSEANVAISLANWGIETTYVTCLPDNDIGKTALRSLKRFDVDTSRSLLHGDRIGVLYLETGAGTRASKVIMTGLIPAWLRWNRECWTGKLHYRYLLVLLVGHHSALSESAASINIGSVEGGKVSRHYHLVRCKL
jgi:2-dehydro-3-deoxygluconokinase